MPTHSRSSTSCCSMIHPSCAPGCGGGVCLRVKCRIWSTSQGYDSRSRLPFQSCSSPKFVFVQAFSTLSLQCVSNGKIVSISGGRSVRPSSRRLLQGSWPKVHGVSDKSQGAKITRTLIGIARRLDAACDLCEQVLGNEPLLDEGEFREEIKARFLRLAVPPRRWANPKFPPTRCEMTTGLRSHLTSSEFTFSRD